MTYIPNGLDANSTTNNTGVTLAAGYIPECSDLTPESFSEKAAALFDPRSGAYYVDLWWAAQHAAGRWLFLGTRVFVTSLPAWLSTCDRRQPSAVHTPPPPPPPAAPAARHTVAPALVFGGLAVLGLAFFLFWMCYQHRRTKRAAKQAAAAAAAAQFVTEAAPGGKAAGAGAAPARGEAEGPWWRPTWGRALKLFVLLVALALVGVSGWGIARSIDATDNTIRWAAV